jgi:flagellar biosynthesis protein FlhG
MQTAEFQEDQASGLRRMLNPQPVRVIAVSSGKGGVGKTNVSVNLAVAMQNAGHDVLIMDGDLGLANADVLLGVQPVTSASGVKLVPAASGTKSMTELSEAEHTGVVRAFSELSMPLDTLIVDTAAGISDGVVSFVRAAREVLIVVCDEPASITDAYALIKVLSAEYGVNRFHVLANMAQSAQHGRQLFAKLVAVADRFLDVTLTLLGVIPRDDYLLKAVQKRKPVVEAFPRSRAALAFNKLVQKIDRWPIPDAAAGHLEFFVERLIQYSADQGGPYS